MALTPVKTNQPITRAAAQTPAQKTSAQVVSDAATVTKLFKLRQTKPAAFRDVVAKHNAGKPQPELAAFDRMARRAKNGWSEKVGNTVVRLNNLTTAAQGALATFGRSEMNYRIFLIKEEGALFDAQKKAATTAATNYENSINTYKGSPAPYPSRAAVDKAIAAIDTTWAYGRGTLNAASKQAKAELSLRADKALLPKYNSNLTPSITKVKVVLSSGPSPFEKIKLKPGMRLDIYVEVKDTPQTTYSFNNYATGTLTWPPTSKVVFSGKIPGPKTYFVTINPNLTMTAAIK